MAKEPIPGLTAAQTAAWQSIIGLTVWLPAALDEQLRRDAGLSNFEYGVLSILLRCGGQTMRLKELTQMADSNLSRMSKVMDRFEQRGWVRREPDPDDGRSTFATLTASGRTTVEEATPQHVQLVHSLIFDRFSDDEATRFGVLAERILQAIGSCDHESGGTQCANESSEQPG